MTGPVGPTGPTGPSGTVFTAKTTLGPARRRYLDGTTGSTTQDVFYRDVFNVKDYGAYGNGTNDDTTSINAAIAALQSAVIFGNTLGTLYFPQGVYKISNNLTITLTGTLNCTVKGDGKFSSIIYQTGSAKNGLTVSMTTDQCPLEIFNLGFTTNTTAACAISVVVTSPNSMESIAGITIRDINITTTLTEHRPHWGGIMGYISMVLGKLC
ncbi:hypothetical protein CCP3SC1_1200010 [Gammaproteobacteria bacterium]